MTQVRKVKKPVPSGTRSGPAPVGAGGARPLSARSVIGSTLLGIDPPRLTAQLLVRSGEAFGISEGTTRVALSRMLASGELEQIDGWYHLAGPLLDRHGRQQASRAARHRRWDGAWTQAVVVADRRDAPSRAALREAMRRLKCAELREGVWMRPDNLPTDRSPESAAIADEQCRWFGVELGREPGAGSGSVSSDARELAAQLWDLEGWAAETARMRGEMAASIPRLRDGDMDHLAPAFVFAASVLRHLLADPELPDELLPEGWPGAALRDEYEAYEATFKALWRQWFLTQL